MGSSKGHFQPRSATSSLVGQLPARIEVRPDVGALGAASPTNKSLFKLPEWVEPFAKPIAVVPSMMGIAFAFALRARAVAPPILRAKFRTAALIAP